MAALPNHTNHFTGLKLNLAVLAVNAANGVAFIDQNVLFGAVYWGLIAFMPFYWQVVQGKSSIAAAGFLSPYIASHAVVSTLAGQVCGALYKRRRRSWSWSLWFGFTSWTTAMLFLANFGKNAPPHAVCLLGVLVAFGTGSTFQTSMNAIRMQVTKEGNAVAVSTRNVSRYFGGALGTALLTCLLKVFLQQELPENLASMANDGLKEPDLTAFSTEDRAAVLEAYGHSMSKCFYVCCAMMGGCVFLCLLFRDRPASAAKDEESTVGIVDGMAMSEISTSTDSGLAIPPIAASVASSSMKDWEAMALEPHNSTGPRSW